jgi:hypothetical protein
MLSVVFQHSSPSHISAAIASPVVETQLFQTQATPVWL